MVETIEKGVLGMFYPKILMKEFYINYDREIVLGKTIVRYKNGICRCVITKKDSEDYILWDGSGTSGSIRRMTFEELKKTCVIVKFLNKNLYYKGRPIRNIEELEADYKAMDDGHNYHEVYKYIRHKETGEIRRFECRKIAGSESYKDPITGKSYFRYTDKSYVYGIHKLCSYKSYEMDNDDIIKNWELIDPEFTDVECDKK